MASLAAAVAAAAAAANRDPAVDRSLRSVFVGNIPYEATEEQLKDIFSEVGLVVSFRLVYDRETGKPKGYGFCEYQDQETALSAMRNLNGREFSGRALRVDNAASEKNKEELKSLGTGAPVIESPYGEPCNSEEAPESISRAVASLPPEQMFELMKQMKLCVQNSPQEARNMLLQNPQLAYALLQAQVVMRIVDPEIALKMLHRPTNIQPLIPSSQPGPGSVPNLPLNQPNPPASQPQQMVGMHVNGAPQMMQPAQILGGVAVPGPLGPAGGMQQQIGIPQGGPVPMDRGQGSLQHSPVGPAGQAQIERPQVPMPDPRAPMRGGPPVAAVPPRGLLGDGPNDPRGGTLLSVTGEVVEPSRGGFMGAPPHQGPPMHLPHDGRGPPPDNRMAHDMRGGPMGEPRGMMGEPRGPMMDQRGPPMEARGGRDPRGVEPRGLDPRGPVPAPRVPMPGGMQGPGPHNMGANVPQPARQPAPGLSVGAQPGGFSPAQSQVTPQDHEKAALIMQVLQLTPEQIAMLPPEQRQSILILKEQIQKSAGAP
ncbi:cleavage stimulation factor subunit 2-like isoform X1 [Acipenser ruthenus]|uniref:cleavage stimulation factor subunit 2-like isoform X1 n=1 Tax=Acipenser ruthenus TaxID=7906 RepID=UPI00145B548D|nr:cleavage stimulation factor subunit 2-like isoform X1 [Acipenser ruthenus]XP_058856568.1 cleavage stimulation factor subunit 2-like isoform X1 [Acipenser ruthenus]XP_058856569.1 cleavage stimulation factor subunit 2-like isoform X1 [Acipenser ruthenus]